MTADSYSPLSFFSIRCCCHARIFSMSRSSGSKSRGEDEFCKGGRKPGGWFSIERGVWLRQTTPTAKSGNYLRSAISTTMLFRMAIFGNSYKDA
jgi:hypothetical protein